MTNRRTFLAAAAGAALLPGAASRAQSQSTHLRMGDGTEIHVKEWNRSGRPVIFTHAWPLSADIWDYQAVALS
ncbi:MAG: alpha/beta fold hydrolase, partial [Reyranella sp.]|uniref:alpha/beta fold hydrolase n=1 Tax=Reyranella sp. TaxID=1929291 RepID=UPI003D0F16A5